jgi:hypothetical protein
VGKQTQKEDITAGILTSQQGRMVLMRAHPKDYLPAMPTHLMLDAGDSLKAIHIFNQSNAE